MEKKKKKEKIVDKNLNAVTAAVWIIVTMMGIGIAISHFLSELDKLHDLSWENVVYWIDTLGIDHPEIVMQQVLLETGQLSSAICHENNNLFGMKEPRVRSTTALGTKRGHAYYRSYIDSIKDYKLWQDNMYDGHHDYYAFLSEVGYAEARHYIAALKSI